MTVQDYRSESAFFQKMAGLFEVADRQRDPALPAVIVWPEDLATFLLLTDVPPALLQARTLDEAFERIGKAHGPALVATLLRYRARSLKQAFFLWGSARVWRIWFRTMSELARRYRMTVVAGSALVAANRWGLVASPYAPASRHVYNLSLTFDPDGRAMQLTPKVNLVPTQEDQLGLTAGRPEAVSAVRLPDTSAVLATAICYDGFQVAHTDSEPDFYNVMAYLDQQGVQILAQPSANPWWWDQPWPLRPSVIRADQWQNESAIAQLGESRSIAVIINSHLIFDFLDLHFDGQSVIAARHGSSVVKLAEAPGFRGPEAETVLHARWTGD
ncbi:hypothetical protein TPY_3766 [Sulfobacillus acidophilus TPY]|nr:hypothetical protein TPY_3766 [Sulfobacillus acidophilus TPY]